MFQKLMFFWEVFKGLTSLYKKLRTIYFEYRRKKLNEKVEKRKEVMKQIGIEAAKEPSEESDEELVRLYNKLHGIPNAD